LEGRYATALFSAATSGKDNLKAVYGDLQNFRTAMQDSKEFRLAMESPGVDYKIKIQVIDDVTKKIGLSPESQNFFKILCENKRSFMIEKCIDVFESYYRDEMGQIVCRVTSAAELAGPQKDKVKTALQTRAGADKQLIVDYDVNPGLLGGIVVKMGDNVFDFSVNAKLERLQSTLLAPIA